MRRQCWTTIGFRQLDLVTAKPNQRQFAFGARREVRKSRLANFFSKLRISVRTRLGPRSVKHCAKPRPLPSRRLLANAKPMEQCEVYETYAKRMEDSGSLWKLDEMHFLRPIIMIIMTTRVLMTCFLSTAKCVCIISRFGRRVSQKRRRLTVFECEMSRN